MANWYFEYLEQSATVFEKEKLIVNKFLSSKLSYTGQIYTIPKYIKKETTQLHNKKKKNTQFPLKLRKN